MDEFVKSVVEHIIGTDRETEPIQTQNKENAQNQTIYRPNYQRNKMGVKPRQQSVFYCVDTEPESKVQFGTAQSTDMLEEDLRWIRLHAKEV